MDQTNIPGFYTDNSSFMPLTHRLEFLYHQLHQSYFNPFPSIQEIHITLLSKLKQHAQFATQKLSLTPQTAPHEIQITSSRFQSHSQRIYNLLATLPIRSQSLQQCTQNDSPISTTLPTSMWDLIDLFEQYLTDKLSEPTNSNILFTTFNKITTFIETNSSNNNYQIILDTFVLILHAISCGVHVKELHNEALSSLYKHHNQQLQHQQQQKQQQKQQLQTNDTQSIPAPTSLTKPLTLGGAAGKKFNIGPTFGKPGLAAIGSNINSINIAPKSKPIPKKSSWDDSDSDDSNNEKVLPKSSSVNTFTPSAISTSSTTTPINVGLCGNIDNNLTASGQPAEVATQLDTINPIVLNSSPSERAATFLPLFQLFITHYFLPTLQLNDATGFDYNDFVSILHSPTLSYVIFPELSVFAMAHLYHKHSSQQAQKPFQILHKTKTPQQCNHSHHLSILSSIIALFMFLLTDVHFTSLIFMICQWDRITTIVQQYPTTIVPPSAPSATSTTSTTSTRAATTTTATTSTTASTSFPPQLTSSNISSLFSTILLTQLFITNTLYKPSTGPTLITEHAHFLYHSTQPHTLPNFLLDPPTSVSGLLSIHNPLDTLLQCYSSATTYSTDAHINITPHPKLSVYQRILQSSSSMIEKPKSIQSYPPKFDFTQLTTNSDLPYIKKHFPQALCLHPSTTPPNLNSPLQNPKNALHTTRFVLLPDQDKTLDLDLTLTSCPLPIFISIFSTLLQPNHIHQLFSFISHNFTLPPSPAIKLYHKHLQNTKTSSLSHTKIQHPNQSIPLVSTLYVCQYLQSQPNNGYYTPHNPQYLPETTSMATLQDQLLGHDQNDVNNLQRYEQLQQHIPPDIILQDISTLINDLNIITELTQMELELELENDQ